MRPFTLVAALIKDTHFRCRLHCTAHDSKRVENESKMEPQRSHVDDVWHHFWDAAFQFIFDVIFGSPQITKKLPNCSTVFRFCISACSEKGSTMSANIHPHLITFCHISVPGGIQTRALKTDSRQCRKIHPNG